MPLSLSWLASLPGKLAKEIDLRWAMWHQGMTHRANEQWLFENQLPDAPEVSEWPGQLPMRSEPCSSYHFYLDHYRFWCQALQERPRMHRKPWEFFYIAQALQERGLLADGKRGLGFGVGQEPLTALFASRGCEVVATELGPEQAVSSGWFESEQYAMSLAGLNERGICPEAQFEQRVQLRHEDMNAISAELKNFDFTWSACCLEHLGSIENGLAFIENSLSTLKVGGWAVHTTELNLSSNWHTIDNEVTVLFRQRDLDRLMTRLRALGHYVEPFVSHRGFSADNYVDLPPYRQEPHLRLKIGRYASTSVGIIVQRGV